MYVCMYACVCGVGCHTHMLTFKWFHISWQFRTPLARNYYCAASVEQSGQRMRGCKGGRQRERRWKESRGGNWSSRARPSTGVRSAGSKCSVVWEGEWERERGGDFGGQNDNTVTPTSIATPLKSDGGTGKRERPVREGKKEKGSKAERKRESGTNREKKN